MTNLSCLPGIVTASNLNWPASRDKGETAMDNQELAGRHFTTSAIHIIEQLWPRAADRGITCEVNEQTVPTLALWALLRWERKLGLVALERTRVKAEELARDVGRVLDE